MLRMPASCLHEMPQLQLTGGAEPHILVFCFSECEEVKVIKGTDAAALCRRCTG